MQPTASLALAAADAHVRPKKAMDVRDYLDTVATQLVIELTPILAIKGVTSNTDLLGKYTEASIHYECF